MRSTRLAGTPARRALHKAAAYEIGVGLGVSMLRVHPQHFREDGAAETSPYVPTYLICHVLCQAVKDNFPEFTVAKWQDHGLAPRG
jgi:hypothetical protein